jgi:hypothetical protein
MADEAPITPSAEAGTEPLRTPPMGSDSNTVDYAAGAIAKLLARPGGTADPAEEVEETPASPAPVAKAAPAVETPEPEPTAEASEASADDEPTKTQPVQSKPERDPEVDRKVREADAAKSESLAARDKLLGELNSYVPQLAAAIQGEFSDIKSREDLYALADSNSPKYNPDRYNRFIIAESRLRDAQSKQGELATAKAAEWTAQEKVKLEKLLPDLKDEKTGPQLAKRIGDYASKAGYSDWQIKAASATDIYNLHKAMMYDERVAQDAATAKKAEAELAKAQKKAAGAPTVQKPGTQRDGSGQEDRARSDFNRLQKTGDTKDAARVFQHILNS